MQDSYEGAEENDDVILCSTRIDGGNVSIHKTFIVPLKIAELTPAAAMELMNNINKHLLSYTQCHTNNRTDECSRELNLIELFVQCRNDNTCHCFHDEIDE